MSTSGAPSTPPPPPSPPLPPRTEPPRWAWWVGGIAIPLVGIAVTAVVSGNPDPVAAPAPLPVPDSPQPALSTPPSPAPSPEATSSPTGGPTASASPEVDFRAPAGYAQVQKAMWGLAPAPCGQHEQQLVDLDDGRSRAGPEDGGAVRDPGGAELLYWPDTCTGVGDYMLRALPGTRVGLLRAGMPKSFESCEAAAETGFGALALFETKEREERGFAEGAALCSVTDRGAVAMAVIEHMDGAGRPMCQSAAASTCGRSRPDRLGPGPDRSVLRKAVSRQVELWFGLASIMR